MTKWIKYDGKELEVSFIHHEDEPETGFIGYKEATEIIWREVDILPILEAFCADTVAEIEEQL